MATLTAAVQPTMLDIIKAISPDGGLLDVALVLAEDNAIVQDAVFMKSNNKFTHVTLQVNHLPTGSVRDWNKGVATENPLEERQEDVIQMLRSYFEVDKELAEASGDATTFRNGKIRAFLEGMSQTFAGDLIYSNDSTVAQEQMTGLSRRLNTVDSKRVWNTGGSGSDVTSIYMVKWGADKVYCPYTEGATAGLSLEHLGEDTKTDSNGLNHQVLRDYFKWDYGLTVEDPQCIARVANIETTGSSNTFNEDLLIKALHKMRNGGNGVVLYVNDTVMSQMVIRAKDKANVNLFWDDAFGRPKVTFLGHPVKLVDQIVATETAIS
jgi:hypothetical protein